VLDAGLAGALVLYGLPATASVGAVLVYHAISIWVPGLGGLTAWLATRISARRARPDIGPPRFGGRKLAEVAETHIDVAARVSGYPRSITVD
jgi:hypothetical protein